MEFLNLILILSMFFSTSMQQKRIMGGRDCHVGEFPSLVNIQNFNEPVCGGSILDKVHILTAAHCLREQLQMYTVIAGDIRIDNSASTSRQVRRASMLTLHPNYTHAKKKNDIGIITLTMPLELNELVSVVFLGTKFPEIDTKAIVAGWGQTEKEEFSNVCKATGSTIYPKEKCKITAGMSASGWVDLIPDESQVCAGDVTRKNATYFGDSGGPLYVMESNKMYLIGLTSYGSSDTNAALTIFTYISYYREWITNEISGFSRSYALKPPKSPKPPVRRYHNAANQRKNSVNIEIFILSILASRKLLRF